MCVYVWFPYKYSEMYESYNPQQQQQQQQYALVIHIVLMGKILDHYKNKTLLKGKMAYWECYSCLILASFIAKWPFQMEEAQCVLQPRALYDFLGNNFEWWLKW